MTDFIYIMPSRFRAFLENARVTLYGSEYHARLFAGPHENIIWTCKFGHFGEAVYGVLTKEDYYRLEPPNGN